MLKSSIGNIVVDTSKLPRGYSMKRPIGVFPEPCYNSLRVILSYGKGENINVNNNDKWFLLKICVCINNNKHTREKNYKIHILSLNITGKTIGQYKQFLFLFLKSQQK